MDNLRKIRDNEILLIEFLLKKLNLDLNHFKITEMVDDYEGGKNAEH